MCEQTSPNTARLQIQHAIAKVRKSSFVKNVFIVMSGTAVAQIISFALTPIFSRLYSPSDFGVYGSFNAVLAVISAGVTLEYSQAVMLPKDRGDALNLFVVSCMSALTIGFICLIICLLAPSYINGLMKTNGVWALVLLVSAVFVAGINSSCQAWCVRVKAFKHTAASQVIRSISSSGMKVGLGFLSGGAGGLIISTITANILASLNLARVLSRDLLELRHSIGWERIKQLAKEYWDFPVYSASQNVINALSAGLPVLLLTHFFGIAIAGAYAFGISILQVPMGFVLSALRQVLFQKAGETHHQGGKLAALYVRITAGLFAVALLPSLILIIWSPQIFSFIFGSQWITAGEIARYLVLWLTVVFCNLPAVLFARIIRIQRTVFLYDMALLTVRVISLVLGGLYLTFMQTIILFSALGAAMNFFLIFLVGRAVVKKEGIVNWEIIRDTFMKG